MYKKLLRSKKNRIIGGVAGGIAEYFEIDPVIVRAILIVSAIGWGISILFYIVLWIIVPDSQEEPEVIYNKDYDTDYDPEMAETQWTEHAEKKNQRTFVAGIILILAGAFFLLDLFLQISFFKIWPVFLIGFGLYLVYNALKKKN